MKDLILCLLEADNRKVFLVQERERERQRERESLVLLALAFAWLS